MVWCHREPAIFEAESKLRPLNLKTAFTPDPAGEDPIRASQGGWKKESRLVSTDFKTQSGHWPISLELPGPLIMELEVSLRKRPILCIANRDVRRSSSWMSVCLSLPPPSQVRSPLSSNDRKKYNTVLIIDVHARDIIDGFVRDR